MTFIKWLVIVFIIASVVWNGLNFEINVGDKFSFKYELYPLKRFFQQK